MSINLDPESVIAEAHERVDVDQLTEQQAKIIASIDPDTIDSAISAAADDHFWSAYGSLHSDVIRALLAQHGTMVAFTPESPRHPDLMLKLDPYEGANALSLIAKVDRLLRNEHLDEQAAFMTEATTAKGFDALLALVYRWVTVDESAFTSDED